MNSKQDCAISTLVLQDYPRSTNCTEGDVRLTYRVSNSIGQVEVCVGNTWNAVCRDNGWGEQEADVVCRQLGFVEPPGEMLYLYKIDFIYSDITYS